MGLTPGAVEGSISDLLVTQVKIERPIMRIPMLAIHLNRDIYEKGFKPSKQDHLAPVLATALKAEANKNGKKDEESKEVCPSFRLCPAKGSGCHIRC